MVRIPAATRFTVLLPDEREDWHRTARGILESQGIETIPVRSGQEALDVAVHQPVHCAVLDVRMPQLGGLEVVRLMRIRRDLPQPPPAILLSEHLSDHLLREALAMHVFSVLAKPVELNVLLDALARVLRRRYQGRWPQEG